MQRVYGILVIFSATSLSQNPVYLPAFSCTAGYSTNDNRFCYKAYNLSLSRTDAAAKCASDGGFLASVPTTRNEHYIEQVARTGNSIWLGITCSKTTLSSCKNDDGTDLGPYTNFAEHYPSGFHCVNKFGHESWRTDIDCSVKLPFVCELPSQPKCLSGYIFWNGNCYREKYAIGSESMAENECQKDGAHLVSIHSEQENNFILNFTLDLQWNYTHNKNTDYPGYSFARIGLQAYIYSGTPASHLNKWIDNTKSNFSKIGKFEPQLGPCYGISLIDRVVPKGWWSSVKCDIDMPYICKYKVNRQMPTTLACKTSQRFRGSGTIYSPGYPLPYVASSCYYVITVPKGLFVQISFPVQNLSRGTTISLFNDISDINYFRSFKTENWVNSTLLQSSVIGNRFFKSSGNQLIVHFEYPNEFGIIDSKWILNYKPAFTVTD